MYRWTVKVIIRLMITNLQPNRCLMEVTRQFWRLWRGIFTGFLHIPPSVKVHFQVCFLMKILMSCLKAITYHHRTMSKRTILLSHTYCLQFNTTCARTIALFFGTDRYTKLKKCRKCNRSRYAANGQSPRRFVYYPLGPKVYLPPLPPPCPPPPTTRQKSPQHHFHITDITWLNKSRDFLAPACSLNSN